MRPSTARLALLLAVLSGACSNDFDPPSLVLGPRLLAVVAEPPEAAPGDAITFRALTASVDGAPLTMRASVDLSVRALAVSAGQSLGEAGEPLSLPIEGGVAQLSGEHTARAVEALMDLVAEAPLGTEEAVVRQVYEEVGLTILVRFEVVDASGAVVVEGFKRITLSPRTDLTSNPPAPRFRAGDRWLSGSPTCAAEDGGGPLVAAPGQVLSLSPEEESWLEDYPAFDIEGRLIRGVESGYYSWFTTAGSFDFAVTNAPDRVAEWTAPEEPSSASLWLVVRDGHLGTSFCRFEVEVR